MKINQIIDEYTDTDPEIIKYLTGPDKGYKLLGKGVDQTSFLEPGTGQVLKIFGTKYDVAHAPSGKRKNPKFSNDHKMFFTWAKYCNDHKSNPFLPKFSGFESFYWNDHVYLQIRQEYLTELRPTWGWNLYNMSTDAEMGDSFDQMIQKYDKNKELYDHFEKTDGKNGLKLFYKTMGELARISERKGWTFDLNPSNFMMRNNGTIVILDPWVVEEEY